MSREIQRFEDAGQASSLTRAIRLPHATAMVVGTIIGASIFVQPSEITGQVPSLGGAALVWTLAGILTFFGALVTAELASTLPESGGVYAYLREAFGPSVGFLWGWAMFWTMHSGIIAAISVVFARYLAYFIPLGPAGQQGAAVGVIALLTAVNYVGVRQGSVLQTAVTAGKVGAILLIIVAGFTIGAPASPSLGGAVPEPLGGAGIQEVMLAMVAALFAFGGWHMVTYNAEETFEPRRTIPRALTLGILTVTVCYIALNAVYFYVLPLEQVVTSDRVAADAADAILGSGGGSLMAGLVVFSTFGALSGIVLAGPRVYYAMARDGLLFRWIGRVHPRYRTPHRAIALQGLWSAVLVATGSYAVLFRRVIYTEWIFFGFMAIGLFVLRRKGLERGYSVWGFPVVPIVFTVASFAIVLNQVVARPVESLTGLSFVLVGIPVYLFWARRNYRRPDPRHSDTSSTGEATA